MGKEGLVWVGKEEGLTLYTIFANIHSTSSTSTSTPCNWRASWNVDMGIRVDLSEAIQLFISSVSCSFHIIISPPPPTPTPMHSSLPAFHSLSPPSRRSKAHWVSTAIRTSFLSLPTSPFRSLVPRTALPPL
jgi:hypothetical protein